MSEPKLNLKPIEAWIKLNQPGGKEKLAVEAGMSFSWLQAVMAKRKVPGARQLVRLSEVVGVSIDKLVVKKPRKKAASK